MRVFVMVFYTQLMLFLLLCCFPNSTFVLFYRFGKRFRLDRFNYQANAGFLHLTDSIFGQNFRNRDPSDRRDE